MFKNFRRKIKKKIPKSIKDYIFSMKKKNLVVYLFTIYDDHTSFLNFIKNYTQRPAGEKHKLLICFKLINNKKLLF